MKMTFTKLSVSALLALFVTVGCSKGGGGTSKTKTELITLSAWKYDTSGIDADKNGSIDYDLPPGYVDACDKDNIITFISDGSGTTDEGATKCDPADPQTGTFTWSFKNNETIVNFPQQVYNSFDGDVTLKTLTETKLVLVKEVNIGGPNTVNIQVELKH